MERLGGRVVERTRAADGAAPGGEAWYLWCVWPAGRGSADDLELQISEADQVIAVRSKARAAGFPGFLAAKRQTDRLARLRAAAGLVEVSDPRAAPFARRTGLTRREVPILRNRQRALVVVESPLDRFGPPPPALPGDDVYDRERVYDVPPTFNSGE